MSSPSSITPHCTAPIPANPTMHQHQELSTRLQTTITALSNLERQAWDLRDRFAALPPEVQRPDIKRFDEHSRACRFQLSSKESDLHHSFVAVAQLPHAINVSLTTNDLAKAEPQLSTVDARVQKAQGVYDDVENSLLELETLHRRKTLDAEREALQERRQRLFTYFDFIQSSWEAIDLDIRESAKLDMTTMRFCIAEFESPSSMVPPFQVGMRRLDEMLPQLMEADFATHRMDYIEGWSSWLNEVCRRVEEYLNQLRGAVGVFQAREKEVREEKEKEQKARALRERMARRLGDEEEFRPGGA